VTVITCAHLAESIKSNPKTRSIKMKTQRLGAVIAVVGAAYLVTVAWVSSWWYVPASLQLGPRFFAERTPYGGTAFSVIWASSGVLGAIIVALGVAVYSAVGTFRLLLLAACSTLLVVWLVFWSTSSHNAVVFGVGGGLILLCFLTSCRDWARSRRHLGVPAKTASDLRLAAHVSFFIAAWGLCGLLGAPTFALRSELTEAHRTAFAGSSLAIKVLVCLVLGWGFTTAAQSIERRERKSAAHDRCGKPPMRSVSPNL
jgi:hypothetical protein